MAKQVFSKEERHAQAVKIGVKFAKSVGLARVSLGSVAAHLEVTAPLLFHVFGSRANFHKAIAKAAKAQGVSFPEAQPTVRADRAARRIEREKVTPKVVKKAKKAKVVAPVVKAAKKAKPVPKVVPPVVKATPRVRAPKVVVPKFPTLPVPETVAAAA